MLGDPKLYEVSAPVEKADLAQLTTIIQDLHDTLMAFRKKYHAGRAIAAPQIGIQKRLLYLYIDNPVVFINPVLTPIGNEKMEVMDDCMSFPNLLVKVLRYKKCRIQYRDMKWQEQEMTLEGDLSELLQHEYDHLDGILATMRAIDNHSYFMKGRERMKKIGILGGISHASTLRYYETLHDLFYQRHHNYYYPEMTVESLNFQYFTDLENKNRMDEYCRYILQGLHHLKNAGADFAIMAANSPHSVFEKIMPDAPLPVLSIVDAVGQTAQSKNMKRLLLTGIGYTMRGTFYQKGLEKYNIEVVTPTPEEQDAINEIIFSELVVNKTNPSSKEKFLQMISGYLVDGIILGCTELPQLVSQSDIQIPLLNSLMLHCTAALDFAER